jgi:hypothetical protein
MIDSQLDATHLVDYQLIYDSSSQNDYSIFEFSAFANGNFLVAILQIFY